MKNAAYFDDDEMRKRMMKVSGDNQLESPYQLPTAMKTRNADLTIHEEGKALKEDIFFHHPFESFQPDRRIQMRDAMSYTACIT